MKHVGKELMPGSVYHAACVLVFGSLDGVHGLMHSAGAATGWFMVLSVLDEQDQRAPMCFVAGPIVGWAYVSTHRKMACKP